MKHVVKRVPDPDEANAREGLIAPQPLLLDWGSYIYRFASHNTNFGYHASPWWILQKDFEDIVARADRAGVDLGKKARWDLVVLQKWGSKMNVAVEARVSERLWAWSGLAKPQQEQTPTGKAIRMYGNRSIRQLYLCGVVESYRYNGIVKSGMLTPRGRQTLGVTGAKVIASSSIF